MYTSPHFAENLLDGSGSRETPRSSAKVTDNFTSLSAEPIVPYVMMIETQIGTADLYLPLSSHRARRRGTLESFSKDSTRRIACRSLFSSELT